MNRERFRIITIDDNRAIHDDYRKVLCPSLENTKLDEATEFLFGAPGKPDQPTVNASEYLITSAFQGEEGVELVRKSVESNQPFACAFIDVRMPPGIDGVEATKRIWDIDPDLPVVLCTAYSDHSWEEISSELCNTDKLLILKKPFDPIELRQVAAAQTARWNLTKMVDRNTQLLETRVDERTQEINETRDLVFFTLARLAESRDPETGQHLERIEGYCRLLVQWLSQNGSYQDVLTPHNCDMICRSSILHDIGKVGIPDNILLKPGRLTGDEFEIMKEHARIGAEALEDSALKSSSCDFLSTAAEIARCHHEKYNGMGYPNGLSGNAIPLSARIVAVADVFDALTSERVYKSAMPAEEAKMLITSESGEHFDPEVVAAFLAQWDGFRECAQRHNAATELPLFAQLVSRAANCQSDPALADPIS